jgi:WD40 repeat protein
MFASDSSSLTFTPDGKQLISTGGGWLRRWDMTTGRANLSLGDGARATETFPQFRPNYMVTADGKTAIRVFFGEFGVPRAKNKNLPLTEYDLETGKERAYQLLGREKEQTIDPPNYLSPDGKTIARKETLRKLGAKPVASVPGGYVLWTVSDGKILHVLEPKEKSYTGLAFSHDGKTFVLGDESHTIRIFDLATGQEQRSFGLPDGNKIDQMIISPDGKWLVTTAVAQPSSWPGFLWLWNLETGKQHLKIDLGQPFGITTPLFTADSRMVVGCDGYNIRTWEVPSGKPKQAWTTKAKDDSRQTSMAVSPDSRVLATMQKSGVIRFWDLQTGQETYALEASPCALETVGFSTDGNTISTIGKDLVPRQWDAPSGRQLEPAVVNTKEGFTLQHLTICQGGDRIGATYWNKEKFLFTISELATRKVIFQNEGILPSIAPDGRRVAAYGKGVIRVFDAETGMVMHDLPWLKEVKRSPTSLYKPPALSADGETLIAAGGGNVLVWDVRTGKLKASWDALEKVDTKGYTDPNRPNFQVAAKNLEGNNARSVDKSMAVSFDGTKVAAVLAKLAPPNEKKLSATGTTTAQVVVFKTDTGEVLHQMNLEEEHHGVDYWQTLAFSPDGKRLALGQNWKVTVWELGTEKPSWQFEGHLGAVTALAFSRDGKRLVSASEDSTALVWDLTK